MADWRFLTGWSEAELAEHLRRVADRRLNFSPDRIGPDHGWLYYYSQAVVGRGEPGPPNAHGPFARARAAVIDYEFSDPRIVAAHFDPAAPLPGRRMLVEIRVLGVRCLCGVVVGSVLEESLDGRTVFGLRYETLEGHIEEGFEWFVLTQDHVSGKTWFRIQATWRPGRLARPWNPLGFRFLARRYHRAWHRLAYVRLREIVGACGLLPLPTRRRILHEGPELANPSIWRMSREPLDYPLVEPDIEREGAERRRRRRPPRA